MDRRSWTLLLCLAAIWGASYMFIKIGVRDLSPAMVSWGRIALAAAVLVPIAVLRGQLRLPNARVWVVVVLAAVQVAGPFLLIAEGEEEISSGLAGILVASTPLFAALLAIRLDHEERSHGARMWGIVAGLVGVGLLLGVDLGGTSAELLGGAAILLASLGYAVGGFIAKHGLAGAPPTGIAAWVMVVSTVLLAPAAILTAPSEAPGAGPVAAVVALGVLGTGVAFAIFYDLMARVGPARTFVVTYLAPAFAVVYGATLLDETISVSTIAGLALIVGGSYLAAEGRLPGSRRKAADGPPQPPSEPAVAASSGAATR
ncbi:MAG TPA: DMT family transporter [Solirubrobacterales bacterium]|nr:DMT family transporter [Solirubrobacterales bacterium]